MKYFIPITGGMLKASAYIVALLLLAGVSACKKENKTWSGEATLTVKLAGTESDEGNNPFRSSSSQKARAAAGGPQVVTVPFGDSHTITVTLEEEGRSTEPSGNGRETVQKRASVGRDGEQRAVIQRNELGAGVRYGILMYDNSGNLFAEREYTHGTEGEPIGGLTPGVDYTFIGYSINSTSALPSIFNKATLATVRVLGLAVSDQDLMTFKQVRQVVEGPNNTLEVVLKHRFTEILPRIAIATSSPTTTVWGGQIDAMGTMSFNGTRETGTVWFADESMTYSASTWNRTASFPAVPGGGTALLEATAPVLLANPATNTGNFTIQGLTINGITDDVSFDGLVLDPGKKYNLNLTFNAPCIAPVGQQNFSLTGGASNTWNIPAGFGFVFNITRLDNSLNVIINGTPVIETQRIRHWYTQTQTRASTSDPWGATVSGPWNADPITNWAADDMEFERHSPPTLPAVPPVTHNVQFVGGDRWGTEGVGGLLSIHQLQGASFTVDNPTLRIAVDHNGVVTVTGRKSVADLTQYPVELIAAQPVTTGNKTYQAESGWTVAPNQLSRERQIYRFDIWTRWNTVTWNSTANNVITISQNVVSTTYMDGDGYGIGRVVCP